MATRGKAKVTIPDAPKKWVIRWGDHLLREQDMTLGDLEDIEERTGKNWFTINPMRDAKHAVAIVSTMVARLEQRDYDEVRLEVRATGNEVFFDAYGAEEDDLADVIFTRPDNIHPEAGGNPPAPGRRTGTSSGSARTRGSGRQK